MKYRKDYEALTRRKVPKDFTVHHIDHDRQNGDILNLVALPAKLHVRYHQFYPRQLLTTGSLMLPVSTSEPLDMLAHCERMMEFARIRQECLKWVNFRNALLGIEENIFKKGY